MRPDAATLRLAVFPRSGFLTDVLLVLAGTGFVALAAQVSFELPFTPVPITGQTFAVLLVGASLGALLGLASLGLYLFVGALWLAVDQGLGFEDTLEAGLYPFVVGDLLKLYLAGALLPGAWRLVERLRG